MNISSVAATRRDFDPAVLQAMVAMTGIFAVTRPPRVHVAEMVVRPNKDLNL